MNPVEQAKNEAKSAYLRKQLDHPASRKAMGHSIRQEAAKRARSIKNARDYSNVKTLRLISKSNNLNLPNDLENHIKTMLIEHAGRNRPKKTKVKKTKSKRSKAKKTVKH